MVNGSGVKSGKGTVAVRVPALHDHVITARLNMPVSAKALQEAQHHLESVLLGLERQFPPTPTGVATTVAWGLPYFHRYIPTLGKTSGFFKAGTTYPAYLPVDLMTSKKEGHTVYALREARTFPSDQPRLGSGRSGWNRMTWPFYSAVTRSPISRQPKTPSSGLGAARRAACSR